VLEENVDGVPVFGTEAPGPFRAGLMFGVGRRDETFARGGLTHLVEHLVMRRVGRTALRVNASVDLRTTEFTAAGSPETVADHLRQVCHALGDLPLEWLTVEADVLRTEDGNVARPAVAALLGEVYGGTGAGLAAFGEPAVGALTADDVLDWSRRYFVSGNAALWASGPLPDGLSLPLLPGGVPARLPQRVRPLETPALVSLAVDGHVALGASLLPLPGLAAALGVLRDRVEDELRHRRGLSYAVEADRLPLDSKVRFASVTADVRPGHEGPAAALLWRCVQRLADDGPTAEELDHQRALVDAYLADPESALDEVQAAAVATVTATPRVTCGELRAGVGSARPSEVRSVAAALRDRALLGVPDGEAVDVPGLRPIPTTCADSVDGRVFRRRRRSDAPRGARLVIGDAGTSLRLPDGPVTVRWEDAIGLLETGRGELQLVGVDGQVVPLTAADWKDGDEALGVVRGTLPSALQVRADGGPGHERSVLLLHCPPYRAREALAYEGPGGPAVVGARWTALAPDGDPDVAAAGLSAYVGRHGAVLLLREDHADLEYVLFRNGQERDRHVWGGAQGDPRLLAETTGLREAETAALLAADPPPDGILSRIVDGWGLPPEVPRLLAGQHVPEAEHLDRGRFRDALRASLRGDFDRPDGLLARYRSWERRRTPSYRVYSAVWVVGLGALTWWLVRDAEGLVSGRGALAGATAALGLTSLWYGVTPGRE
jgi:hypothetical protein